MRRRLFLAAALLGALAACSYITRPSVPYVPEGIRDVGAPETGREWYLRDCAWCHGNTGQGSPNGPPLVTGRNGPALTDFMLRTGRMPISDPEERIRRGEPAYSEETIAQLVEYVSRFGGEGPDVPAPRVADADLALGQRLYQSNCAACHSATGIGGTLTQGGAQGARQTAIEAPGFGGLTPVEIAEAMLAGPGTMPVFGRETFSNDEIDAIVRYVMLLQDPRDEGGADLGRVGPVAEGAVAWIVGLGALLFLARWIGKTVRDDE